MKRSVIVDILRDACRAPSGDNAQPWRFSVCGTTIRVINVPEKDTSLFNWQQATNHLAIGAAIENLRISAAHYGFATRHTLFPDKDDALIVAQIELRPADLVSDDLYCAIATRATNRRKYLPKKIESMTLAHLTAAISEKEYRIAWVVEDMLIQKTASLLAIGERFALENRAIHDFLFDHVTWTKDEDEIKHGFFIDTFEFTAVQKRVFRACSKWGFLKYILPFGIATIVEKEAEKIHQTSAAFGAIILPNRSPHHFVIAGMQLERLWLTATRLGLALQPTTTVQLLGARIRAGGREGISDQQQKTLEVGYKSLSQMFGVTVSEEFGFVFRIGYAPPASAVTTRFEPDIHFESDISANIG